MIQMLSESSAWSALCFPSSSVHIAWTRRQLRETQGNVQADFGYQGLETVITEISNWTAG